MMKIDTRIPPALLDNRKYHSVAIDGKDRVYLIKDQLHVISNALLAPTTQYCNFDALVSLHSHSLLLYLGRFL
jgi:hypothetical protein